MARGQAHRARILHDDRNGRALGEVRQRRRRIVRQSGGDDQRPFGARDPFSELGDRPWIGMCRRRLWPRLDRADRFCDRSGQRLARQHEVDRPTRARHRDFDRARHDVADLVRHAQFVIPFHHFAQHAGLVEHFLRPVNRARARAERTLFGDRGTAGGEDERHAVARQVGEIVDGVRGANVDVHHHRLRMPVHQVGAVRHGDREVFVRHQNRLRHLGVGLLGAAEGFDNRRKIRAGIAEEVVNAVIGERAQEGLGGNRRPLSGRCGHCAFRP